MPSLNTGTMTFGELFVMLVNPVRVHRSTTAPCVDHCSCNADIANAFGDTSQSLLTNIESSLSSSDLASISVSPHTVSKALSHLKSNKSDGT